MNQAVNKAMIMLSILFLSLILSLKAKAQNQCLRYVSDSDLLAEVQRRMQNNGGANPGNPTGAIAFFTCDGSFLTIELVNSQTGGKANHRQFLADKCAEYSSFFNSKLGRQGLARNVVVSYCDGSFLIRTLLTTGGDIKSIDRNFVANDCFGQSMQNNNGI